MKVDPKKSFFANKMNRIIIITILINVVLVVGKLMAGYLANSKALLADGLHSASDVITSIGVIIGMAIARKPRDEEHQYGHERVETIVTFLLAIALLYTGTKIGLSTILSVINKEFVAPGMAALFMALASIAIKEFQYQITYKTGKEMNSGALIADAWHHRSDALSSVAAFIGIGGAKMGYYILDPIAGVIVSLIVIKVGFEIFKECFQQLIDVSIHLEELEKLKDLILKQRKIYEINDIRTRRHGSKVFVDVRVSVDPDMDIYDGHTVTEEVEDIIRTEVKNVEDVIVHLDPYCCGNKHKNQELF
ncbi:cation diffusion facilitator family transporter [Anaerovirgula multivorans]|uniref:Cation diffusion facilitator family transporter n=1 Tax=Anaerovirgula multivorans TaxID=312168 RepID=A0A239AQG0_9FIRM|nr:cation diffusion facilitator family transporter [Anaerovirgula multivorans]SNR97294.1 cation diffusion facilitator family transporter [Anaerovirgula multivorans]